MCGVPSKHGFVGEVVGDTLPRLSNSPTSRLPQGTSARLALCGFQSPAASIAGGTCEKLAVFKGERHFFLTRSLTSRAGGGYTQYNGIGAKILFKTIFPLFILYPASRQKSTPTLEKFGRGGSYFSKFKLLSEIFLIVAQTVGTRPLIGIAGGESSRQQHLCLLVQEPALVSRKPASPRHERAAYTQEISIPGLASSRPAGLVRNWPSSRASAIFF